MPATSPKQYGLMAGVAKGNLKGTGVPQDVAEEFVQKTPSNMRSKFMKSIKKKKSAKQSNFNGPQY